MRVLIKLAVACAICVAVAGAIYLVLRAVGVI